MALPKDEGTRRPTIRRPAVAGRFYPADPNECRAWAQRYVNAGREKFEAGIGARFGVGTFDTDVTTRLGGIVPHAGWICSGAIAGETIGALKAAVPDADLIVV